MPEVPHVLIADDHSLFRQGLKFAITDGLGGARVSEAATMEEAIALLGQHPDVDLITLDVRMPGMDGGEGLRTIRRLRPGLPITVISALEDRRTILSMLDHGASGFIPKGMEAEAIVAALRDIMAGRIFVPPTITAIDSRIEVEDDLLAPADAAPPDRPFDPAELTARQREVLGLLMQGRSSKEIARALDIAEGTVKVYLAAIFRAMGARNRVEAITRAIAAGLGPPSKDPR